MTDHEHDIQVAKEMLNRLRVYDYRQDDSNVVMCLAYIHDGLMATEAMLNEHAALKRICDYVKERFRKSPEPERAEGYTILKNADVVPLLADTQESPVFLTREGMNPVERLLADADTQEQRDCDNCETTGLLCPIRNEKEFTFPCPYWQPLADTRRVDDQNISG